MGMEAAVEQSPPSPADLVRAARRGDRAAFGALPEPDLAAAHGTGRITGSSADAADAADAVQEALLSAWHGLESLRDRLQPGDHPGRTGDWAMVSPCPQARRRRNPARGESSCRRWRVSS
jgi:hypothetical protein